MDALVMKELLHFLSNLHALGQVETPAVGRDDNSVASQLPDVELVQCQDAVHLSHQLLLQRVHLDVGWNCLEEDKSRFLADIEHHQHDGGTCTCSQSAI